MSFRPAELIWDQVTAAFVLGLRYDLRWIAIVLLPVVLLSIQPGLSPFYSDSNKRYWTWYLAILTFVLFFFFAAGFGSFSYNQTPLDAGAMNFAEDFTISVKMIWQTYPLLWMLGGLFVAVLSFRWMYHKSHWQVISQTDGLGIPHKRGYFLGALCLLILLIHGSLGPQSLKREDSFRFQQSFLSYLSINPLQNFVGTLSLRQPSYNQDRARALYPVLAEWMGWKQTGSPVYLRSIGPRSTATESKPNIVLIQCESFSMYKSSMSGNPLNTTPFFDSLSKKGVFFDRCFAPTFSTARALFAILTGIPDAQLFKFSSQNPQALDQYTLINGLEGYQKHYFLGGDAEFNNFEGVLRNIKGLIMHTGQRPSIPPINVWGISDKDLLLEAHQIFDQANTPFFAYIQTSGNHRPFQRSIPVSDSSFIRDTLPEERLNEFGFESVDEYNAFRYTDYCFRSFFEKAARANYFSNTIFVLVGDHGVSGNARAVYPSSWTSQRLTDQHVPLLFYAPGLLAPQKRGEVVSQIDVLPTLAGLLHRPYENRTLGRDLLDPSKTNHFAFVTNASDRIGIITNEFYFTRQLNTGEELLLPLNDTVSTRPGSELKKMKRSLSELTDAFFETARYLIMNNKNN
ncbi:MAG: LTA synthase family protein [Bacteroidetes bacterium]|nr:LTA synthase family protein [Bacteroidota bacterium]